MSLEAYRTPIFRSTNRPAVGAAGLTDAAVIRNAIDTIVPHREAIYDSLLHLTDAQKIQFAQAEEIGRRVVKARLAQLGIPNDFVDSLSYPLYQLARLRPWQYIYPSAIFGGFIYDTEERYIRIDRSQRDALNVAVAISGHELYHATGRKKLYVEYPSPENNLSQPLVRETTGVAFMENGQIKGLGIEQGLALLFERNIYQEFIGIYSQESRRREHAKRHPILTTKLALLNASLYRKFFKSNIDFAIDVPEHALNRLLEIDINIGGLKMVRIVEELCKILGHEELKSSGQNVENYDLLQAGRDLILDFDHFTGSEIGVDMIKKIFGDEANIIFSIDDRHNFRNTRLMRKAMKIIKRKEKELGIR